MKKLSEIILKKPTISFEFFPPKTEKGLENLFKTIGDLAQFQPDFMTCTYGAGGGSRDHTLNIVRHIQQQHHIPAVHHLTCVCHSKTELKDILSRIQDAGVRNVLALRGDAPKDNPNWTPGPENFKFSSELVAFIRQHFADYFGIGVAGFPEGHLLSPDRNTDVRHLKIKMDAGADVIITQLFFDNQDFLDYLRRVRQEGITKPVIAGILPITDYKALLRFTEVCGATVPQVVHDIFQPIQDDPEKVIEAGIAFALRQCRELLEHNVDGLHFYVLNKLSPIDRILPELKKNGALRV